MMMIILICCPAAVSQRGRAANPVLHESLDTGVILYDVYIIRGVASGFLVHQENSEGAPGAERARRARSSVGTVH